MGLNCCVYKGDELDNLERPFPPLVPPSPGPAPRHPPRRRTAPRGKGRTSAGQRATGEGGGTQSSDLTYSPMPKPVSPTSTDGGSPFLYSRVPSFRAPEPVEETELGASLKQRKSLVDAYGEHFESPDRAVGGGSLA